MRSKRPSKVSSPELAQEVDLLVQARAAGMEILSEGFVFDIVPSGSDAEPEALARQQVEVGGLLGQQHGLALGQDQDAGDELDALGHAGQVGEHDHRIVERMVLRIGAPQGGITIGVAGARHVVEGQHVVEAHALHGQAERAHIARIAAGLGLRIDGSDPHGVSSVGLRACAGGGSVGNAGETIKGRSWVLSRPGFFAADPLVYAVDGLRWVGYAAFRIIRQR
jgi:hypothetical protein